MMGEHYNPSGMSIAIPAEVRRILEKAHATAKGVLEGKRDKVESLAALLLEKEVVERDEFLKVVACDPAIDGAATEAAPKA